MSCCALHGPADAPLFRSYSLSGPVSTSRHRISVKIEPNGDAGAYLRDHVRVGDVLEVSSPRGSFVLAPGEGPVALLSAGIGATPVLAMLYALSSARSMRPVLWLHAARDGKHIPFVAEVRRLMSNLAHGRSYVCFSRPEVTDRLGTDFDASGRLSRAALDKAGLTPNADVYLCGPQPFMADMRAALTELGVEPNRVHVEMFNGGESLDSRGHRRRSEESASAAGRSRNRSPRLVRAQRHRRPLGSPDLSERAGARRGLRRPGALGLPDRCLPQLRERSRLGKSRLRA